MGDSKTTADLLTAIRSASGLPSLSWAKEPTQLTGGFWAELWKVSLDTDHADLSGDLVARVMPDPETAAHETTVQTFLSERGYPTPKVRLSAGPGAHLDRAWMLMDLAKGGPLLDDLSGSSAILDIPRIARDLPNLLARHAASLHAMDREGLDLAAQDNTEAIESLHSLGRSDLGAAAERLRDQRPLSTNDVICHGDLHPFNILSDPEGDTVLDWSNATIAHPAYDIAYTQLLLINSPLDAPAPLRPIIAAAGRFLAGRFIKSYESRTGASLDEEQLSWSSGVHAVRILGEIAGWEANGTAADHADHPWLTMQRSVTQMLEKATGVTIRTA